MLNCDTLRSEDTQHFTKGQPRSGKFVRLAVSLLPLADTQILQKRTYAAQLAHQPRLGTRSLSPSYPPSLGSARAPARHLRNLRRSLTRDSLPRECRGGSALARAPVSISLTPNLILRLRRGADMHGERGKVVAVLADSPLLPRSPHTRI